MFSRHTLDVSKITQKFMDGKGLSNSDESSVCRYLAHSVITETLHPKTESLRKIVDLLLGKYAQSLVGDHDICAVKVKLCTLRLAAFLRFLNCIDILSRSLSLCLEENVETLVVNIIRKEAVQRKPKKWVKHRGPKGIYNHQVFKRKCYWNKYWLKIWFPIILLLVDMVSYNANVKKIFEIFGASTRSPGLQELWRDTHEGRKYEIHNLLVSSIDEVLRLQPLCRQNRRRFQRHCRWPTFYLHVKFYWRIPLLAINILRF